MPKPEFGESMVISRDGQMQVRGEWQAGTMDKALGFKSDNKDLSPDLPFIS